MCPPAGHVVLPPGPVGTEVSHTAQCGQSGRLPRAWRASRPAAVGSGVFTGQVLERMNGGDPQGVPGERSQGWGWVAEGEDPGRPCSPPGSHVNTGQLCRVFFLVCKIPEVPVRFPPSLKSSAFFLMHRLPHAWVRGSF